MRASDIFAIIFIAIVAFLAGIGTGRINTVSKSVHVEQLTNYRAAIDSYRDYVVALEKSADIPNIPALEVLRKNVSNNIICDLPSKEEEYQVMNVYKSYK